MPAQHSVIHSGEGMEAMSFTQNESKVQKEHSKAPPLFTVRSTGCREKGGALGNAWLFLWVSQLSALQVLRPCGHEGAARKLKTTPGFPKHATRVTPTQTLSLRQEPPAAISSIRWDIALLLPAVPHLRCTLPKSCNK